MTRSITGVAIRLLLADDHRMLREGLRRSMADEGFDVVGEASNGREAVDAARILAPDVVLMDVSMPDLDGVGAVRALHAEAPQVRVVMLTMHADADIVAAALEAGACGYLVKDCSIEEIAEAVRLAVDGDTAISPQFAASMLAEGRRLDHEPDPPAERVISVREAEVLQLVADGCTTSEVAGTLFISQKTVKNHLAAVFQKLDAHDRTQAVVRAVRMGIIRLD